MKDKPKITEVMMLALTKDRHYDLLDSNGIPLNMVEEEHERFIVPLKGFVVEESETQNKLIVPIPKSVKPRLKKYKRVTLSLTDDPFVTWASDWSHLGCFRLVYKYYEPTVEVKGNKLIVSNKRKKDDPMRDRDLTVPDRRFKKVMFK